MAEKSKNLDDLIRSDRGGVLEEWLRQQSAMAKVTDVVGAKELREESSRFLEAFAFGLNSNQSDIASGPWNEARNQIGELSRSRAKLGFSPSETATFVFSLKQALFDKLLAGQKDAGKLAGDLWSVNQLLDKLGLYSVEVFQDSREEMIRRQQQDLMELSTPVVKLWDRVLALPIIGTLDSARTQSVMESLLQAIVDEGAEIAIIDITGVPTVDTLVAQHLLKTVSAARLMGADCIISGIRPQIAQTIVHLGVTLDVATKATMADAFALALKRVGLAVGTRRAQGATGGVGADG
jgi:rsbT co-antagonist protein RsbR